VWRTAKSEHLKDHHCSSARRTSNRTAIKPQSTSAFCVVALSHSSHPTPQTYAQRFMTVFGCAYYCNEPFDTWYEPIARITINDWQMTSYNPAAHATRVL
jgi:hypothetical protein